ncbi:UNVERIFIED_CONTAM: hypothetical protein PYX00_008145 [Menopon gallinae]|uniref:Mitochondrial thiamine pyrophosphate carrier n=1 Tax=Menopon gallinae TaxID=328185 RepID=A0AAW2HN58_9NEOP
MQIAFAGGFSGLATRFLCQPLDVLKILFQVSLQVDGKTSRKYKSVTQAITLIIKEEGLPALWKGLVPAQILSIIFGAVQFSTYENVVKFGQQFNNNTTLLNDTTLHFYAGGVSGVTATISSFPFDTIRTRLVAQHRLKVYKGFVNATKQIMIHEGPKGYLQGLLPACALTLPSSALTFGFKNVYNCLWNSIFVNTKDNHILVTKGHLVTGLLAGISSKVTVYPLDVIKKRLQIQGMDEGGITLKTKPKFKGFLNCLVLTIRYEGFLGLYKGLLPALIKAGAAGSIYFTIYNEVIYFMKLVQL